MAFTENEITEHALTVEKHFWSQHRPPLHLRDKIREGQRIKDQSIELFYSRPAFMRTGEFTEESIAKVRFVRTQQVWYIFWKRADGKWHRYPPEPEAGSLLKAINIINKDSNGCFFG